MYNYRLSLKSENNLIRMYIVVHFEDENLVEAVPKVWYKNGKCVWPIKSLEARKLIEIKSVPSSFEYKKSKARVLSNDICT